MIDTGQTNGRCTMGNPNYGDYDKERVNLVENATRNQNEGRQQVKDSMVNPRIAATASDTAQLDIKNMFNGTNDQEMNQVSAQMEKN